MKRYFARLAAVLAIALFVAPLGACDSVAAAVGAELPAVANGAVARSTVDDRAWAVALAAYDGATEAYTAALKAGLLSKAQVAAIRPIRLQAVTVRRAGSAAFEAGNADNLAEQVRALQRLTGQMKAFLPGLRPAR